MWADWISSETGKVSDRQLDFQNSAIGARAEAKLVDRRLQESFSFRIPAQ
jgi:hypothetical protein